MEKGAVAPKQRGRHRTTWTGRKKEKKPVSWTNVANTVHVNKTLRKYV
jgi:hypothetical protein